LYLADFRNHEEELNTALRKTKAKVRDLKLSLQEVKARARSSSRR
jgi:hypothetical protein